MHGHKYTRTHSWGEVFPQEMLVPSGSGECWSAKSSLEAQWRPTLSHELKRWVCFSDETEWRFVPRTRAVVSQYFLLVCLPSLSSLLPLPLAPTSSLAGLSASEDKAYPQRSHGRQYRGSWVKDAQQEWSSGGDPPFLQWWWGRGFMMA